MNDLRWFRLALRAIGILVLALALPNVITWVGWSLEAAIWWKQAEPMQPGYIVRAFAGAAATTAQTLLGLYLLIGGEWLVRFCTSDLRASEVDGQGTVRCPECGYLVSTASRPVAPGTGGSS